MSADAEELRLAMRNWATGVCVVAVALDSARHGMTVNTFTSLSLDPPYVMISLERVTKTHQLLSQTGCFAITILRDNQQEISDRFAGRLEDEDDRFTGLQTFTLVSGAPFLSGGLSFFDCQVVSTYPAGTHTVFIGEVLAVSTGEVGKPLLYFHRDYHKLC
jgi:flavin reductase (DIM6/NTAB) family NADH-FMN oxidoreductase RutF